ncbi:MAG TPA: YihY/virulence factor BrkB family protein [Gemmatimonadaceae bacterium]|nr:YihY/virulence factor BrkB family protein [Gemmatimonadaceae bacterium]
MDRDPKNRPAQSNRASQSQRRDPRDTAAERPWVEAAHAKQTAVSRAQGRRVRSGEAPESGRPVGPGRDRIGTIGVLKRTFADFGTHEGSLRAAALAYYAVFALPPLLILLILFAGLIWSPAAVENALEAQFAPVIGGEGAKMVRGMVSNASRVGGVITTTMSAAGVFLGATGAFLSLQSALNRVWDVMPDPSRGGVRAFLKKRLLSFGIALAVAFLLVVSLAVTTAVAAVGERVAGGGVVVEAANNVMNTVILGALFATIFKVLPDAEVTWRDVWLGGGVTAVLLDAGKFAIGLYLGRSRPGNPSAAASALAAILIWIYYASALVLLGAEFTKQWAKAHGREICPEPRAVKVEHHEHIVDRR